MSDPLDDDRDLMPEDNAQGKVNPPVAKQKARQALAGQIHTIAVELNKSILTDIATSAKELGIDTERLTQHFTLIAPVGEQRNAMR